MNIFDLISAAVSNDPRVRTQVANFLCHPLTLFVIVALAVGAVIYAVSSTGP